MTKKTQVELTKKQERSGWNSIESACGRLSQVIKSMQGLERMKLEDCNMTLEEFLASFGVVRPISEKGKKCAYNAASIMAGWHEGLKEAAPDGKSTLSYVFKNVPAKVAQGEIGDPDARYYRVFTKEEAEKLDGKPISVYMKQAVPTDKWSIRTIRKGLCQSKHFADENNKAVESQLAWQNLEHVYIVRYDEVTEDGKKTLVRKVVEVQKSQVTF